MGELTIHHQTFIRTSAERIFAHVATAEGWDAWFTQGTSLDLDAKQITLRWKNFGPHQLTLEDGGPILTYQPPRRFAFEWSPLKGHPTKVTIVITPVENGSVVTLRETGYPDTDIAKQIMLGCATGWGEALTLLKFYLEHGIKY
jgi:uncharacterized protein YndB with AHSA1/START domain